MKCKIAIILLIVCSIGMFGRLPQNALVNNRPEEILIQNSSVEVAKTQQEPSFQHQINNNEEKQQKDKHSPTEIDASQIKNGVIVSLIGAFICWCISQIIKILFYLYKRHVTRKEIDKNEEQIYQGCIVEEDKFKKLENEIDNNPKILQEEKKSWQLSILELRKKNSILYFERGLKYYGEEPPNLNSALEDFNNAIEQNPLYKEAYYYRGMVNALKNRNEDSLKDFDKAIELNPHYIEAYTKRGELKDSMGSQKEAKEDFAMASLCKGISKAELGKYEEAIEDYDEAIRLNPNFAGAYYNRGIAKGDLGDYTGAIADHDEAIRLNPDDAEAYFYRGNALRNLNSYTGAIVDYDHAIRLNQDFEEAYFYRGITKGDLEDYTGAIADYDEAIRLNPDDAGAYSFRAKCYKMLAEEEKDSNRKAELIAKMEEDEQKAKELVEEQVDELVKKGSDQLNKKEYDLADRLFTKAINLKPNSAKAYFNRGICKEKLNSPWGALNDYTQAIQYDGAYMVAYMKRGNLRIELKEYGKASEDFTSIIELDSNSAYGYKKRAQCYRLMAKDESDPTRKKELNALAEKDEKKANDLN